MISIVFLETFILAKMLRHHVLGQQEVAKCLTVGKGVPAYFFLKVLG